MHELRTDIVYDEVDGVPLRFDHYRPRGVPEPAPAIVFVHGGAWVSGDPSQAAGNALHAARRGIATVALSYRLAPHHPFPAPLHDVRRGLRWIRAHASEIGIDPKRLVLMGLSAGAHLVVLAHLSAGLASLEPEFPPELRDVTETVRGIVAHYGPYDLTRSRSPWIDALLGPAAGDAETARRASPLHHSARARVPLLLVHGTGDEVVSWRESARMHEALQADGKASELVLLDGAPHAFQIDWHGEANRRANAATDAFLTRILGR